jgi:hypothetical protein
VDEEMGAAAAEECTRVQVEDEGSNQPWDPLCYLCWCGTKVQVITRNHPFIAVCLHLSVPTETSTCFAQTVGSLVLYTINGWLRWRKDNSVCCMILRHWTSRGPIFLRNRCGQLNNLLSEVGQVQSCAHCVMRYMHAVPVVEMI